MTELVERSSEHTLGRGGMRRLWLRGLENVQKRYLLHVAGFNLGLLMRTLLGYGTPRAGQKGGLVVIDLYRDNRAHLCTWRSLLRIAGNIAMAVGWVNASAP